MQNAPFLGVHLSSSKVGYNTKSDTVQGFNFYAPQFQAVNSVAGVNIQDIKLDFAEGDKGDLKRLRLAPSQARRKRRQRRGAASPATATIPADPCRNRAIGAFRAIRSKTAPPPLFPNAGNYGKILSTYCETVEYRSACLRTEEEQ